MTRAIGLTQPKRMAACQLHSQRARRPLSANDNQDGFIVLLLCSSLAARRVRPSSCVRLASRFR
jgi:hypothetical protein